MVGLSGGSLADEPVCVALPPRDLVGILRSVEVARFKTGEVLHTTALHECQKRTEAAAKPNNSLHSFALIT